MTIDEKIRDEKFQDDLKRKAPKISELSSGKIDIYEHLTGEEVLDSNRRQIVQQAKFTYSPLGKLLKKKRKRLKSKEEGCCFKSKRNASSFKQQR